MGNYFDMSNLDKQKEYIKRIFNQVDIEHTKSITRSLLIIEEAKRMLSNKKLSKENKKDIREDIARIKTTMNEIDKAYVKNYEDFLYAMNSNSEELLGKY